jgi:hypothetical protein
MIWWFLPDHIQKAKFYNFTIGFNGRFDIFFFSFYFTDFSTNKLYWIDNVYKQIRSSNLNGTDIKLLTTSPVYMPWAWGLIIFGNWIYWTSFTKETIYRVDKESGLNFEIVHKICSRCEQARPSRQWFAYLSFSRTQKHLETFHWFLQL